MSVLSNPSWCPSKPSLLALETFIRVDSVKALGIIIDKNLNWTSHVANFVQNSRDYQFK